jgi:hypothetical protein
LKIVAGLVVVALTGCASVADSRDFAVPDAAPSHGEMFAAVETPAAPAMPSAAAAAIATIATGTTAVPIADEPPQGGAGEVKVTAPREDSSGSSLREERRIGSNEQPEWTTERPFSTVRAYVTAPGQIEVEQWYKLQNPRGSAPNHYWQTEFGMGFEGGWQADIYINYGREPDGPTKYRGVQYEVRKALAKWGVIPLNPTLYAEYKENYRDVDAVELKVLLAEEIARGWHWAGNLIWERQSGGDQETELGVSMGVMHTLIDSKFSAGMEAKFERVTGKGFRGDDAVHEFLLGPSFQWRPTENMHVNFTPLFGLTSSDRKDPRTEIYLVIGYDFGPEREGGSAPVSTRSN